MTPKLERILADTSTEVVRRLMVEKPTEHMRRSPVRSTYATSLPATGETAQKYPGRAFKKARVARYTTSGLGAMLGDCGDVAM